MEIVTSGPRGKGITVNFVSQGVTGPSHSKIDLEAIILDPLGSSNFSSFEIKIVCYIFTAQRVCIAQTLPSQDVRVLMVIHIKVFSPQGSPTILV